MKLTPSCFKNNLLASFLKVMSESPIHAVDRITFLPAMFSSISLLGNQESNRWKLDCSITWFFAEHSVFIHKQVYDNSNLFKGISNISKLKPRKFQNCDRATQT